MKLYFSPHNLCLPICKHCTDTIQRHSLIDKHGVHWHPNCYEHHIHTLLTIAEESFKIIIEHTHDNNSGANSVARRALNRLTK